MCLPRFTSILVLMFLKLKHYTRFPNAVRAVFPERRIQKCIVYMVRNSVKLVSYKDLKVVCAELKAIYRAPGEKAGMSALKQFGEKRQATYPLIYKSLDTNRTEPCEFFKYPEEIRRVIYTTDAIESLNYSLRKATCNRSVPTSDEAVYKIMYPALRNTAKKWTMPIKDWGAALNQFALFFGGRIPLL
jgi:transposase-like protein